MPEDYVIEAVTKEAGKKKMKAEVQNELKEIRNIEEHRIQIKENATPVIPPPRKIPAVLRDRLKKEWDTMEKKPSVIKRIEEPTEWVNSLVLVEKPDGSLRTNMSRSKRFE